MDEDDDGLVVGDPELQITQKMVIEGGEGVHVSLIKERYQRILQLKKDGKLMNTGVQEVKTGGVVETKADVVTEKQKRVLKKDVESGSSGSSSLVAKEQSDRAKRAWETRRRNAEMANNGKKEVERTVVNTSASVKTVSTAAAVTKPKRTVTRAKRGAVKATFVPPVTVHNLVPKAKDIFNICESVEASLSSAYKVLFGEDVPPPESCGCGTDAVALIPLLSSSTDRAHNTLVSVGEFLKKLSYPV